MYRKCKTCHFYGNEHWCYWLGTPRHGNQEECEDGYVVKSNDYDHYHYID